MTDSIDIGKINTYLKALKLDMMIKPVTGSINHFWLLTSNNRCSLKVPAEFVVELKEELESDEWEKYEQLRPLFEDYFLEQQIPGFVLYPKSGFIAKDFAEFYICYDAIENGELLVDKFNIENISIEISYPSDLFVLLNKKFEDDYLFEIEQTIITIKLKGTSKDTIEDDLYSALYYLNIISPDPYGDFPTIETLFNEEIPQFIDPDEARKITTRTFSKPSYPTALKFFCYAESHSTHEAILYYYKVLEHFFEIAWHRRITDIVLQTKGNIEELARLLNDEQPHKEYEFLFLVLKIIMNEELWQLILKHKFCSRDDKKLTETIYRIRNEIAHGKNERNLNIIVPSLITDELTNKELLVFRAIAKEAILKLAGVSI